MREILICTFHYDLRFSIILDTAACVSYYLVVIKAVERRMVCGSCVCYKPCWLVLTWKVRLLLLLFQFFNREWACIWPQAFKFGLFRRQLFVFLVFCVVIFMLLVVVVTLFMVGIFNINFLEIFKLPIIIRRILRRLLIIIFVI